MSEVGKHHLEHHEQENQLRATLLKERQVNADLLAALEEAPTPGGKAVRERYDRWFLTTRRAAIARAKGDAEPVPDRYDYDVHTAREENADG